MQRQKQPNECMEETQLPRPNPVSVILSHPAVGAILGGLRCFLGCRKNRPHVLLPEGLLSPFAILHKQQEFSQLTFLQKLWHLTRRSMVTAMRRTINRHPLGGFCFLVFAA
jgi:hypothetical protein